MRFRFNYLDIRFIRFVTFGFIINRIHNLRKFQIRRKIVNQNIGFYNSSPLKENFRPRKLK